MEDLWAFNEEIVARAIHDSRIPVISAVGHEPDVTISDFVADLRAATPSNAAELAVPDQGEIRDRLLDLQLRMGQGMRKNLERGARRLGELASRPVMESPLGFVQQRRLDLDRLSERLAAAENQLLSAKKQKYIHLAASLEAMSPLKVLSRGFSVATDPDGRVLRSAAELSPGDRIHIRMEHGGADCRVEKRTEE